MGRIEKRLADAGYRMLGLTGNKEELILDILKTKDHRYLKAIPFLIYQYNPDLDKIYLKTDQKAILGGIIGITKKIFNENNIIRALPNISEKSNLDYEEFRQEFEIQKYNLERPQLMTEKQKAYAERDLQVWLSQLFTKKEKQIIRRILSEKPVSKTDYEYYSRKTKKKLNGIINIYEFAKTLYTKSPYYDKDLFKLKRLLEQWLKESGRYKDVEIRRFSGFDEDKIFISFEDSTGKVFSLSKKLKWINNKEILTLLEKYKGHDFES